MNLQSSCDRNITQTYIKVAQSSENPIGSVFPNSKHIYKGGSSCFKTRQPQPDGHGFPKLFAVQKPGQGSAKWTGRLVPLSFAALIDAL